MARSGAHFCDNCGGALQSAPAVAEYKQVTVLFADVVRSMDIAATLGPERLREIMASFLERSAAVVHRYGGTVDKFIGDGLMALFGAPIAMEDHALRACRTALSIQEEAQRMATELAARDGIEFRIRVGLNSGEVIAGQVGSGPASYTVIGEQVGLAQRMESVAPPAGVLLSESTARLVIDDTRLAEAELVTVKGAAAPVSARRLLAIIDRQRPLVQESVLVGRRAELTTVQQQLASAASGRGAVLALVGAPGVGKSRLLREAAAMADSRGMAVCWSYCQSHTRDIPSRVAAGLLRDFFEIANLDAEHARQRIRAALPTLDEADRRLLDDLLGVADPLSGPSDLGPDARRRRLTAILDTALLNRTKPTVYVIEDAHWIDRVSESMLSPFAERIADTPALMIVTYRPEYVGALAPAATATVTLEPLADAEARVLTADLLGSDPSVTRLAGRITERAAGNPFFTEEIVRELAERGVLQGFRGAYRCHGDVDVTVPATVQAAIAARLDRLSPNAKRTLAAAAVIGSPFPADLLASVLDGVNLAELVDAELISPLGTRDYAFRHPLMRTVAYRTQLKSVRAQLHRRIAAAIETMDAASVDANAAVIATHLEAAGDLRAAFDWRMRAGGWSTHRNIEAARMNWARAAAVADALPVGDPERLDRQIAPRTLLCATVWRVGGELSEVGFEELRELTERASDKRSLAIGMSGQVQMLNFHGRYTDASALATEQLGLLDAIDDPELTVGLIPMVSAIAKWDAGQMTEAMQLAQHAIDLSGGDPTMGDLIFGSPLAMALVLRASTRCCLGVPGWQQDFDDAVAMAAGVDRFSYSTVLMFRYIAALNWALVIDDQAVRDTRAVLEFARQFGDDFLLTNAQFTHGLVQVRHPDGDRALGFELLARAKEVAMQHRYTIVAAWCADLDIAADHIRTGAYGPAIAMCEGVLEAEVASGEMLNRGWATTRLVEALLARGAPGDLPAARAAVERLAAMPTEPVYLFHELPLLRLRGLLARAVGDDPGYREYRDRYRARAEETGFAGHIALARAMT